MMHWSKSSRDMMASLVVSEQVAKFTTTNNAYTLRQSQLRRNILGTYLKVHVVLICEP